MYSALLFLNKAKFYKDKNIPGNNHYCNSFCFIRRQFNRKNGDPRGQINYEKWDMALLKEGEPVGKRVKCWSGMEG